MSFASTFFFDHNEDKWINGPSLIQARWNHATVVISNTCSMVIGGLSSGGTSASTFYYDHNEGEWTTGPSLMQARSLHAAGIVTDEVTDENFVAVTGGYYSGGLDSTEILQDGNWIQGKIKDATICVLPLWKIYGLEIFIQNKLASTIHCFKG